MRHHALLAVALVLAACSGKDEGVALAKPVIDTLPGGVVRVTNSGGSAWADSSGWTLVEDLVIAPAEGSPGEIGEISDVVGDEQGNTYVFQRKPTLIRVYGPDGAWVRDIGREGDGPGEYRSGMFGIVHDTLFIQDPNNTRFTTFTTSGQFIGSHTSQCCWWTSNFPIFADGTVGIPGPPPPSASERSGAVYLTRLDGTVVDTILMPPRQTSNNDGWTVTLTQGKSRSMMSMSVPLKATDQSAYMADRRKVVGHTSKYELAITDLHDDTLRIFSAPAPALSITDAERDSIFEEEMEKVDEQWREAVRGVAKKSDIPLTWPLWSNIMVDGRGRIWVSRPGTRGEVSVIDVFSSDGVLLGTVAAPEKFAMRGRWVGDRLYQPSESDDGLPQVKVYRVDAKVRTNAEASR